MNKGAVAVALIIATTACSGPQKGVLSIRPVDRQPAAPAQDALARGDLLFSRGEYALALDAFRRPVRNDPTDATALNRTEARRAGTECGGTCRHRWSPHN